MKKEESNDMNRFKNKRKIKAKFNKNLQFLKKKLQLKIQKNNKNIKDNNLQRLKFRNLNKKSLWYLS